MVAVAIKPSRRRRLCQMTRVTCAVGCRLGARWRLLIANASISSPGTQGVGHVHQTIPGPLDNSPLISVRISFVFTHKASYLASSRRLIHDIEVNVTPHADREVRVCAFDLFHSTVQLYCLALLNVAGTLPLSCVSSGDRVMLPRASPSSLTVIYLQDPPSRPALLWAWTMQKKWELNDQTSVRSSRR